MATATTASSSGMTASNVTPSAKHSHAFTCVTCAIAFRSSELQRAHMRSDWHRYNLKRRVASLPPLSSEIFAEKVLSAQASSSAAAARASFEKLCEVCQKTYYSENAYSNHLGSQKHKARVASNGTTYAGGILDRRSGAEPKYNARSEKAINPEIESEFSKVISGIRDTKLKEDNPSTGHPPRPHHARPEDPPSVDSSSSEPAAPESDGTSQKMPISRCLFCNYDSPSLKLSILHMTKFHALFIPEQVYLVDLEGLISYLQAKVTENHECLFCHKLKGSTSGVQTHMRDKGHCMIAFDSEEEMIEIGQFYDFRSTYSDEDEDDSDATMSDAGPRSAGAKLGARRSSKDVEMEDGNDGWETDSSASSLDSSELHAVPIDHDHAYDRLASHRHHTHSDPRAHRAPDGFHSHAHSHHAAFHSDHELHLPSGRTAGHRSLARYYRQNLHSYPTPEERVQQRMITAEAANGAEDAGSNGNLQVATRTEGGLLGVTEQKRREVATITKRQQKRAQRDRSRFQWGKEKGANSQKHFRDDNFGIYRS